MTQATRRARHSEGGRHGAAERVDKAITSGAHSLYLSIFDQGDRASTPVVVLDRLALGDAPARRRAPPARAATSPRRRDARDGPRTERPRGHDADVAGTAGTAPGDLAPITVKIYAGPAATGTPVPTVTGKEGRRHLDGRRDLGARRRASTPAKAEQSDAAGNAGTQRQHVHGRRVAAGDLGRRRDGDRGQRGRRRRAGHLSWAGVRPAG